MALASLLGVWGGPKDIIGVFSKAHLSEFKDISPVSFLVIHE